MYRALISPGRNLTPALTQSLTSQLVKQFENSPLCSSVLVEVNKLSNEESLSRRGPKFGWYTPSDLELEAGSKTLMICVGGIISPGVWGNHLDSLSFISSLFRKFPSTSESTAIAQLAAIAPTCRISAFRLGWLLQQEPSFDAWKRSSYGRQGILDAAYSAASQFLPTNWREINTSNLALAIRLNYETCERMLIFNLRYTL